MALANGEEPTEMSDADLNRWREGFDRYTGEEITLGLMASEHDCDYEQDWHTGNCYCEEQEFSWSSCDVCGSHLGGHRSAVTFWIKES